MRAIADGTAGLLLLLFGHGAAIVPSWHGQVKETLTSHFPRRDVISLEQRQEKKSPAPVVAEYVYSCTLLHVG